MEKRIERIQRWLQRCTEACRMKKWHAAVMEIESARADLEQARSLLWEKAQKTEPEENRYFVTMASFFRRGGIALVFVFFMALPLSMGERRALPREEKQTFLLVTRDEKELLSLLRRSLSDRAFRSSPGDFQDFASFLPGKSGVVEKGDSPALPRKAKKSVPLERKPVRKNERDKSAKDVKRNESPLEMDEVLALVQMGERALRERVITVVTE